MRGFLLSSILLLLLLYISPAVPADCSALTFSDNFSSNVYSRQDGSEQWATNWLEIGERGTVGPSGGDVSIANGELVLSASQFGFFPRALRELNLAGYKSITLSFDYQSSFNLESTPFGFFGADTFEVSVSSDAVNYTVLQNYVGVAAGSATFDISAFASANTRILFSLVNFSYLGPDEEMRIDNVVVTAKRCIVSVSSDCDDNEEVVVVFEGPLSGGAVTNANNYSLNNGATVSAATVNANRVTLTTSALAPNTSYTLQSANPPQSVNFVTGSTAFVDTVSTAAYGNNEGPSNWSFDWIEVGETAGAGPAVGDLQIVNGGLRLTSSRFGFFPRFLRGLDLSGYTSATLSFDYQSTNNIGPNDRFEVGAATNNVLGTIFDVLQAYTGNASGSASFDITPYISSTTGILFSLVNNSYLGANQFMTVDNIVVTARKTCPPLVDHFNINHSATAVTCQPETVTITAQQADNSTASNYTGTVNLSTSTGNGDWLLANGTSIAQGSDTGNASYTFTAANNGVVQLQLKNTNAETVNINLADGTTTERSGSATAADDPNLVFSAAGFRFYDGSEATPIKTQLSGKNSNVADQGLSSSLFLQAIKTDTNTGACQAALVGSQNVNFSYQCITPNACSAARPTINGTAIPNTGSQAVAMDFGNATANASGFVLNYPDAGNIRLTASYSSADAGTLTGNSAPFVVKPAGLCVEALTVGASSPACTSNDALCSAYVAAGDDFTLQVSGKAWQSAGETNSDFCNNPTTANFAHTNIALTPNLIAPAAAAGGQNANLSAATTAIVSGGTVNQTQTVDEVGVFSFTATPPNYLGQALAASSSASVGRFIPDHFLVVPGATPLIAAETANAGIPGDTSYTYLGQAFTAGYTLRAMDADGSTITTNYEGSFAKHNPVLALSYGAVDAAGPTKLNNRLTHTSSGSWADGSALISSMITIARAAAVDGPFAATDVGVLTSDSDGVGLLASAINLDTDTSAGNDRVSLGRLPGALRYGRVFIPPVYGSEINDGLENRLQIPFELQYFNGTNFVSHTDDDSSRYDKTRWTEQSCVDVDTSDSLVCTEAQRVYPDAPAIASRGVPSSTASLQINRPGAGNTGSLNITIDVDDWLTYNWDGTGGVDNPSTRVTFGSYRGHDRIIYWRERSQ